MREIDFHPHALYKMASRGLSADEIIAAVLNPEHVLEAKWGRKCVVKRRGEYDLRIIFEEEPRRILIITAYITRRR